MVEQKKMGRPRSFDIDIALSAAMYVFWEKGYDGASMKDLTHAMGINSPSLYAVFGNKESLFIQAIERYMTDDSCAPIVAFESEKNIEKAVRAFMQAALDHATQQPKGRLGCFMANCVSNSVGTVDKAQDLLQQAIFSADSKIAKRFEEAKTEGQLPTHFPSMERARLMFDLRQGHVLRARAGIQRDAMEADLDYRVHMVLYMPASTS